jgi:hypothetical protein
MKLQFLTQSQRSQQSLTLLTLLTLREAPSFGVFA